MSEKKLVDQMSPKDIETINKINKILVIDYNGKESDIPENHEYHKLKNQLKKLKPFK